MSAMLALETGEVFYGKSFGVAGIRVGEIVFNTSMTGYQEILTDPSYSQQIITFTYPHIGNTGINLHDFESTKIHAAGLVVKSYSSFVSNWRSEISLQDFILQQNTIAITDVDTRGLTKILRQHGLLRACIVSDAIDQDVAIKHAQHFPGLNGVNLATEVTTREIYIENSSGELHIVVIDFGIKESIKRSLVQLNCKLTIVPANTPPEEILKLHPNGILLSNGPGDPAACLQIIDNIKQLIATKIPLFGICLGHQLLALTLGARCYKMNFGHHGGNHPVQNLFTKKVLITSQNHGFAVQEATLSSEIEVTHRSLFDQTVQGVKHKTLPIFGFQGHPEAGPGPHDALNIFNDFIEAVRNKHA